MEIKVIQYIFNFLKKIKAEGKAKKYWLIPQFSHSIQSIPSLLCNYRLFQEVSGVIELRAYFNHIIS